MALDVRDPESVRRAADLTVEGCGCLPHMVVNNAAGNFVSPTERLSPNAFKTIVDIVLNGTATVSLEFGKRLIDAGQGGRLAAVCNAGMLSVEPLNIQLIVSFIRCVLIRSSTVLTSTFHSSLLPDLGD